MTIAGADGCRPGWVAVRRCGDALVEVELFNNAAEMFGRFLPDHYLLIDVPIGLPQTGQRTADRLAREILGWPRRCSVFPAPIRPILEAAISWEEANHVRRQHEGKGMSRQAWGICDKVREVDDLVRKLDPHQDRILEGHPEVSFAAWAGAPMAHAKKRMAGRNEREALIAAHYGAGLVEDLWHQIRGRMVARDDLIDAFAMLWSAERLQAGIAVVIPSTPELDSTGLRMEIVY